jgi:prepilin-type N-terminal cleavage/methylation domain-containing protein
VRAPASCRGFTLLELLVTLLLLGLLAGLVLPPAAREVERASRRAVARQVVTAIEGLPARAFRQGQPIEIDAAGLMRLLPEKLPPGNELRLEQPLRYGADGVASGGAVELKGADGSVQRWRVASVTGEVSVTSDWP